MINFIIEDLLSKISSNVLLLVRVEIDNGVTNSLPLLVKIVFTSLLLFLNSLAV